MIIVDDQKIPWKQGMTITHLLEQLNDGHIYAVVRLNDKLISKPNFDKTLIPDQSIIILIPMIAGG